MALFCRQKRITEKGRPTPKLNLLSKVRKGFVHNFKDCNYEWLTASTSYFVGCVYFLIQVKGHGIINPWTLFPSDRWVLYYLMSIYHAHCFGGVCGALIILWCGVWMSSICTVLLLRVLRHFRVTWMCIVTCVLADYFYWPCREIYKFTNLSHPNLAYCWNFWSTVIVVESLCAA